MLWTALGGVAVVFGEQGLGGPQELRCGAAFVGVDPRRVASPMEYGASESCGEKPHPLNTKGCGTGPNLPYVAIRRATTVVSSVHCCYVARGKAAKPARLALI
jgi:hypothetical protein